MHKLRPVVRILGKWEMLYEQISSIPHRPDLAIITPLFSYTKSFLCGICMWEAREMNSRIFQNVTVIWLSIECVAMRALYHCLTAYKLDKSPEHWADLIYDWWLRVWSSIANALPCVRFIMIQQRINHTYSWPKHWADLWLVVLRLIINCKWHALPCVRFIMIQQRINHIASSHKIAALRHGGCWWETSGASRTLDSSTPAAWELWGSPAGGHFFGAGVSSGHPPGAPY
jgi:hypothetical protein